jgi:hypothetical protein
MRDHLPQRREQKSANRDAEMRRLFKSLGRHQSLLDDAVKHSKQVIRAAQSMLTHSLSVSPR